MYKKLFLAGIVSMAATSFIPVSAHDSVDHQFRDQKHQVHDAANNGMISPQQHQVMDAQRNSQHAAIDNRYPGSGSVYSVPYANGAYTGSYNSFPVQNYAGYGGYPTHANNPGINPGHNNSIGHRFRDAINGNQSGNAALYQQSYPANSYGYNNQVVPNGGGTYPMSHGHSHQH